MANRWEIIQKMQTGSFVAAMIELKWESKGKNNSYVETDNAKDVDLIAVDGTGDF